MQSEKKEKVLRVIGSNIQDARKATGKEIKEVAHILGISVQAYGNIENGKTDIGISRILELAEIYQTNFQQILSIENNKATYYNATSNQGGYNIVISDTVNIDDNKKMVEHLEEEIRYMKEDIAKRLSEKDEMIQLLRKQRPSGK